MNQNPFVLMALARAFMNLTAAPSIVSGFSDTRRHMTSHRTVAQAKRAARRARARRRERARGG